VSLRNTEMRSDALLYLYGAVPLPHVVCGMPQTGAIIPAAIISSGVLQAERQIARS
jgi:hypothetical protein